MWAKANLLAITLAALALGGLAEPALALNPSRALSQYTRTVWTQEHGLPQDTVRAIAQTKDGYLWLGTDEGLAQFDGYDFVVFNKENGALPSNSVAALWAAQDGSLWIGTLGGLTRYQNGKFTTFTKKDGLSETSINSITQDHSGAIWVVAGVYVNRFQDGRFTNYSPRQGLPIEALRVIYCGRDGEIYVAGFGGVSRREGDRFVPVFEPAEIGDIVSTLLQDREGNLWVVAASAFWPQPWRQTAALWKRGRAARQLRAFAVGGSGRKYLGRDQRGAGAVGARALWRQSWRARTSANGCAASTKTPKATCGWE